MRLSPSAHIDTFCRDRLPPFDEWPEFPGIAELAYPARLNCAVELLDAKADEVGRDRPCLRSPSETWSYGDVVDRTNALAAALVEDFGIVPGNRVLLRGPNSPWLAAAWLAVVKAGAVAVATMAQLRAKEIGEIVALTEPAMAICDHRFTEDLRAGAPGLATLTFGTDEPGGAASLCDAKARGAAQDGAFTPVIVAADDVVMLAPTSGTTGTPKMTAHFHRDVLAIADTFSWHVLRPRADDVFAGTPPLGFTFGLGGLLIFPLRVGASVLLLERATPAELADAVAAHAVTVLFTAPTAYRAMLTAGKSAALRTLRRCVSAGEYLPKPVWEQFKAATGISVIDGIGSTEMLHIFIASADRDIRPGATGRPVPGYRAAVVDDDGNELPDFQPGRLAVQGPTGCRYLSDPRQRDYVQRGWNITGDTYIRDADGYYWYQARSDDMIISAGYNIAGPEVEEVLLGHPDVAEVAVVGVPHAERGTVVGAFVVLRDPDAAGSRKAAELQDFVKERIAPYKYPRVVDFVPELPKTISGKTQRFRLRELVAQAPQ